MRWLWDGLCLFANDTHYHRCRNSQASQSLRIFCGTLLLVLLVRPYDVSAVMSKSRKLELRTLVRKTWDHGFNNYMLHAFPQDELLPITCKGLGPDNNPDNHGINDVLGNFSLTLIDSLDTFVVFRDLANFSKATRQIIEAVPDFDIDSRVQVFETTIRVLGGLLSGHLFASDPENSWGHRLDWYQGELLHLAKDLADRMMPAFTHSRTGMPYARVNLRFGIAKGETSETCTAGAGSLLLEFATLSRLTNIPTYENAARKAFYALWNRRSGIDLFGNTINMQTGAWSYGIASIGAGIDSYYEYLLKSHILLQEDSYLKLWDTAYKSVMTHMRSPDGFWYRGVNMQTGAVASFTIDSLAAFFPGLQVLAGDIEAAIQSHMIYANLWIRYSGLPEVFDTQRREATSLGYPLRPEFVESNYFLYQATKDEFYLEMAERVLHDLVNRTWVECGLAGITNLETGDLEDRMNSFVLSETLKYLYLTFDEDNPINHKDDPFVFTTEGHILFLPNAKELPKNKRSRLSRPYAPPTSESNDTTAELPITKYPRNPNTCSAFNPSTADSKYSSGMKLTVRGRTDFELAKMLTGLDLWPDQWLSNETIQWSAFGRSEVPALDGTVIELVFARVDESVNLFPSSEQVDFTPQAAIIKNISGLAFSIKQATQDGAFDVIRVGKIELEKGTKVIITDPYAIRSLRGQDDKVPLLDQQHLAGLRVTVDGGPERLKMERSAMRAVFGPDVLQSRSGPFSINADEPLEVVSLLRGLDRFGCEGGWAEVTSGKVVLVSRGGCKFTDKLSHAVREGASGLVVVNHDEQLLIANADHIPARKHTVPVGWMTRSSDVEGEEEALKTEQEKGEVNLSEEDRLVSSIPLLVVSNSTGMWIQSALDWLEGLGELEGEERKGSVKVEVIECPKDYKTHQEKVSRIVVNGYPLANVVLGNE